MSNWYVYIIDKEGTLYVGVTMDLENRVRQHGVERPLHIEGPMPKTDALKRERTLKGWGRERKLALITESGSSPGFPHPKSFDKNVLWSIILTGSRRTGFSIESRVLGGQVWRRKAPLGTFPWSLSRIMSVFIFS
jgi:predicted GIY-YIG superfamily endonuclease